MTSFKIRPLQKSDREWMIRLFEEHWHSPVILSRGRSHHANDLDGFIAEKDNERIGLLTYHIQNDQCEMVTLNSLVPDSGVGTALVSTLRQLAMEKACKRIWLITSNDNMNALRFYQKRGFHLVAVHQGAIEKMRKQKPKIPEIGMHGIPLRDEIELEWNLLEHGS